jgi:phosphatidylserine decarboxylase
LLFTKYGLDIVAKSMVILLGIGLLIGMFVGNEYARYAGIVIVVVLAGLVLNFFRDPERSTPQDEHIVVSPADGKVVMIKEVSEQEYLKANAVQVSIFMSPLDVHVNRFPISGNVEYFRHIQGEYLVAFDDKSSERNERTLIGVQNNGYKVLFRQIAGAVARRIVAPVTVGQPAVCGERFGMIKFGSRVDVIMPLKTQIAIQLHDRVVAGETVLARYPAGKNAA